MNNILKNLLADHGYNAIALPKLGIQPLQLLVEDDNSVSAIGNLVDIFAVENVFPPLVAPDGEVANLTGKLSVSYEAKAGLNVLDWLLEKLHMGKLGLKANLDSDKVVTITYGNVKEDKIKLTDLDNFLSGSAASKTKFNTYRAKLEDGELYVINAVLKSNAFTVTIEDKHNNTVGINATIQGILGANANFSHTGDNSVTIKNETTSPLVFAFKAQRILYDKKKWWELFSDKEAGFTIKNQQGLVLLDESRYPTVPLEIAADKDTDL